MMTSSSSASMAVISAVSSEMWLCATSSTSLSYPLVSHKDSFRNVECFNTVRQDAGNHLTCKVGVLCVVVFHFIPLQGGFYGGKNHFYIAAKLFYDRKSYFPPTAGWFCGRGSGVAGARTFYFSKGSK